MEKLLNFLFISKCTLCNKEGGGVLCSKCLEECRIVFSSNCIVCDESSTTGYTHRKCMHNHRVPTASLGIFEYRAHVRECIVNAKYSKHQFMALKVLTKHGLKEALISGLSYNNELVVVPVPISRQKYKSRGFNQAEVVAKEVAFTFGLRLNTKLLKRSKDTRMQHDMSREKRFENLKGAFEVNKRQLLCIKGRRFLLVDDIWTTGSTLIEASHTLYKAGAEEVMCFTLSKKEKMVKSEYDKSYLSAHKNCPPKTVAQKL